jgi:hypothetical protein
MSFIKICCSSEKKTLVKTADIVDTTVDDAQDALSNIAAGVFDKHSPFAHSQLCKLGHTQPPLASGALHFSHLSTTATAAIIVLHENQCHVAFCGMVRNNAAAAHIQTPFQLSPGAGGEGGGM